MSAINSVITKDGQRVHEKRQIGEKIDYTRIVMGDGYLPGGVTPYTAKEVVHPVVSLGITKLKINNNGTAIVGGVFSNADIETEFFYRELALMAYDPDVGEVVYCYGNAGDYAERITASGGSTVTEKVIDIVTVVGPAETVTAQLVKATNADEIGYDDSKLNLGADNVQDAIDSLMQIAQDAYNASQTALTGTIAGMGLHVIATRVRDPSLPSYGLGDDDSGEGGGDTVTVTLEAATYTGTAEISAVVSGVEYDLSNASTDGDSASDGTIIIRKVEE